MAQAKKPKREKRITTTKSDLQTMIDEAVERHFAGRVFHTTVTYVPQHVYG